MCCYFYVVLWGGGGGGGGQMEWGELVERTYETWWEGNGSEKRIPYFPSSFQSHQITIFSLYHFWVLSEQSSISVFSFACLMLLVGYLLYNIVSLDGDDFTGVSMDLVFPLGPASMAPRAVCVAISITIDDVLEADESFTVILTPRRSDVIVSPNVTEIRILDDNGT